MDQAGTNEADSLYFEADRLSRDGKFAEAKALLEQVLTKDPTHFQALNFMGWLFETKYYDYNKAREFYEKCLTSNPAYPAANINYAILISTVGDYATLDKHLAKAMSVPGISKSAIYREYGLMFENQANLTQAIEAYKKALQFSTNQQEIDGYKSAISRCQDKLNFANGINTAPPAAPASPPAMPPMA